MLYNDSTIEQGKRIPGGDRHGGGAFDCLGGTQAAGLRGFWSVMDRPMM
jgi:hypothetical protein